MRGARNCKLLRRVITLHPTSTFIAVQERRQHTYASTMLGATWCRHSGETHKPHPPETKRWDSYRRCCHRFSYHGGPCVGPARGLTLQPLLLPPPFSRRAA
ncbi:hypothetical protein NDU88_007756 [Pleurodeles waltl]|uniref:Secreted protein n=1 Tax=Pleurodeles waltl TaxID=8319 RepID=A0AAV7NTZ1_PLEWA|nr:hypothetical protein NDU88_007756 [Pleurodeles waltl]